MEITLEKIELVKDRTGVTYKEAKDALDKVDGNVVEAIIALEEAVNNETTAKNKVNKNALITKMKEIAKKGNVSRIVISNKEGENVLNIPLTVGLLGTVVAPWGMIAGTVAAVGFKCKINFIKTDGSSIDLTEKAGDFYETAKTKGAEVYDGVKEKAPDVYEDIKEKSGKAVSKAKDVAQNVKEKISKKGDEIEVSVEDIVDESVQEIKDTLDEVSEKIKASGDSKNDNLEKEMEDSIMDLKKGAKEKAEDVKEAVKDEKK